HRVTEAAHVDEAVAQREEQGAQDEHEDRQRQVDALADAVPEDDVEEEHHVDGLDDALADEVVDGGLPALAERWVFTALSGSGAGQQTQQRESCRDGGGKRFRQTHGSETRAPAPADHNRQAAAAARRRAYASGSPMRARARSARRSIASG